MTKVLLLDVEQGVQATEDRDRIQSNCVYVLQLLMHAAQNYDLDFEAPADYVEPSPPPKWCGFWLEIVDAHDNILLRISHEGAWMTKREQPPAAQVAALLTEFAQKFDLGMEFTVPVAA